MGVDPDKIRKVGETQATEFKKSLQRQREALQALCGMLNSQSARGEVLFGVSPDGTVVGVDEGNLDSVQKKLAQKVRDGFEPRVTCSIEILEDDGKTLVSLKARRAAGIPYHEYRGRAYIREGSTTRILSYSDKQQLAKRRDRDQHTGPWKCDRCGAIAGVLVSMTITDRGVHKSYTCGCGGEFWPII